MTKKGSKPKLTRKSGNHLGELNHNRTYSIGNVKYIYRTWMVITATLVGVQMLDVHSVRFHVYNLKSTFETCVENWMWVVENGHISMTGISTLKSHCQRRLHLKKIKTIHARIEITAAAATTTTTNQTNERTNIQLPSTSGQFKWKWIAKCSHTINIQETHTGKESRKSEREKHTCKMAYRSTLTIL